MQKKVIKARDVMHDEHIELDGMATVREALDAMKPTNAHVVIVQVLVAVADYHYEAQVPLWLIRFSSSLS